MSQLQEAPASDPDNVPETLCIGRFNLVVNNNGLATLIFTHARPKADALMDKNEMHEEHVVRARIVMTTSNLSALRDLINNVLKRVPAAGVVTGGSSRLN